MACHSPVVTSLENTGADCLKGQKSSLIDALLPSVEGLLGGKTPSWSEDLDAVVAALGNTAVCAIDRVVTNAESKHQGSGGSVMAKPPTAVEVNGKTYMAKHKLKVLRK